MKEEISTILDSILKYDPDKLKRESGDFQFTDVAREIDLLYKLAKDLKNNLDFCDDLPENDLSSLKSQLNALYDEFTLLNNFHPANIGNNPQDIRNSYANTIKNRYTGIYKHKEQLDVYLLKVTGKQADLSNITREAQQVLLDTKAKLKEMATLVETAKSSTSKIALYKYLGIFEREGKLYAIKAYVWLFICVLLSGFILLNLHDASTKIYDEIVKLQTPQQIIGLVSIRLTYLALAFYILRQAIHNYMANMHLSVTNHHRENSLKVFDAMVKSSHEQSTRDQILTHLSQSIFNSGETGFFPGKDSSKDGPDMVQIVKEAANGK